MNRLPYSVILGMKWWLTAHPIVNLKLDTVNLLLEDGRMVVWNLIPEDPVFCFVEILEPPIYGLPQVLKEFETLFTPKTDFLKNPKHGHQFKFIFKEGAKFPKANTIYSLNLQKKETLEAYIKNMLDKGWIIPSKSPIAAPVILVPKAGGSLQLCVDFNCLNNITLPDNYPIPLMNKIDCMIAGCKLFTKLDLLDAFNQISVQQDHQKYTAFKAIWEFLNTK